MFGVVFAVLFSLVYGQVAGAWNCEELLSAVDCSIGSQAYLHQPDVSRGLGGDGSGFCSIASHENLLVTIGALLEGAPAKRSLRGVGKALRWLVAHNEERAKEPDKVRVYDEFALLSAHLDGAPIRIISKAAEAFHSPFAEIETAAVLSTEDIMGSSSEEASISKLTLAFFDDNSKSPIAHHSVFAVPVDFEKKQIRIIDSRFPYEPYIATLVPNNQNWIALDIPERRHIAHYEVAVSKKLAKQGIKKNVKITQIAVVGAHRISESEVPYQSPARGKGTHFRGGVLLGK